MRYPPSLGATAILALAVLLPAQESQPVTLGAGDHSYRWVTDWLQLPEWDELGNTHGCMVVDRQGHIHLNTDTEHAVCVFRSDGTFVRSWGADWKGGLHGMFLRVEDDTEYLYLAHTRRGEVAKTTLDGEVLWTLGYPEEAGIYPEGKGYHPTAVVVGPNEHIYVADGYGQSYVHEFDEDRKYLRSFGGRGTDAGEFQVPHGLWIDTRAEVPRLVVCDRENHRLQIYDFDGHLVSEVKGMLRRPCSAYQYGSYLYVADLAGRVTILDRDNELVTHLGDNPDPKMRAVNGVPPEQWEVGRFISPHSVCVDAKGDVYVMDWLSHGRITKLQLVTPPTSRPTKKR